MGPPRFVAKLAEVAGLTWGAVSRDRALKGVMPGLPASELSSVMGHAPGGTALPVGGKAHTSGISGVRSEMLHVRRKGDTGGRNTAGELSWSRSSQTISRGRPGAARSLGWAMSLWERGLGHRNGGREDQEDADGGRPSTGHRERSQ